MSSSDKREGRSRGRLGPGRRSLAGPRFWDLRQIIRELHAMGYSVDDIVHYLTTGELGSRPEPERPDRPEKPEKQPVTVQSVDLQVATNTAAHRTEEYDIVDEGTDPPLVVRRGQPFKIQVQFSKGFPRKSHDLRLVFGFGEAPAESKRTRASILLSDVDGDGEWGAKFSSKSGESVEVEVVTPPDCHVGKWSFKVEVVKQGEKKASSAYALDTPVYVLFNPWCKDDVVYNEREEDLAEYVLNDSGSIYNGVAISPYARPWTYGQFTGKVLDCSLHLLDTSDLRDEVRGDPVKVVRKLSAMINVQDEDGVLMGNWSGNYSGGVNPTDWTGSTKILEEYYEKNSPVKFGQCWVFSGVFTTICRALGIPCRSITNFASAHDTDTSVTIDEHVDAKNEPIEHMNSDSIWNFHVWNEVWMRRDDLPDGYGGWQVCDATPQEASEGVYQCGPCPLRAIKEGQLNLAYDAPFIFAEVNADKVIWKQGEDGKFQPVEFLEKIVGQKISTSAMTRGAEETGDKREDVTHLYKYPEGSSEERAAVMKAYSLGKRHEHGDAYKVGPKDVECKLDFDAQTPVGDDFHLRLQLKNVSGKARTVQGHGKISTMFYTGIVADLLTKEPFKDVKLSPGAEETVVVTVTPQEYTRQLKDGCFLSVAMVALVEETQQSVIKSDIVSLVKPVLSVKAPPEGRVGVEFEVTVTFTNPLPCTLTDCRLEVEGPGIIKATGYPQSDVQARGSFLTTLKLKPKKKGKRRVTFVFSSRQLDNITGEHEVHVLPPPER